MKCSGHDELAAFLDRELPERRAAEVAAHVAECTVCKLALDRLGQLIGELRAPALQPASATQVTRALARLDEPARTSRVWFGGAAFAIAALAVVAVLMLRPHDGTFTARGGNDGGLAREVGATVYTLAPRSRSGPRAEPLAAGAHVTAATAYAIGYRDLAKATPVWTLAFAIDAHGEIHWLYPAYTSGDPAAAALSPSDAETLMPDAAILDHPATGPLRIVTMLVPTKLHVSAIEALHGDELSLTSLRSRFPAAVIAELHVVVE